MGRSESDDEKSGGKERKKEEWSRKWKFGLHNKECAQCANPYAQILIKKLCNEPTLILWGNK